MRIQESKCLSSLAKEANMTEDQLSETLINDLVERKLISDDEANYGNCLTDCLEPDTSVSDIAGVFNGIGINDIKSKHIECFLVLKIIGDGECPECGGEIVMKTLYENGRLRNVAECSKCKLTKRRPKDFRK